MATKVEIDLAPITSANVQQLKTINICTLPVRYSDKFYVDLIEKGISDFFRFAFWNGFTVGAVCARLEPIENDDTKKKLYIMTLNVLPAYRRRGVATKLLNHIMELAKKDTSIVEVYLHVQTNNDDARKFYQLNGFTENGIIQNYYKRIEPPDCYLVQYNLEEHRIKDNAMA